MLVLLLEIIAPPAYSIEGALNNVLVFVASILPAPQILSETSASTNAAEPVTLIELAMSITAASPFFVDFMLKFM